MSDWFLWSYCINLGNRPDRWLESFFCARKEGIYLSRVAATSAAEVVGEQHWPKLSRRKTKSKIATIRSHRGVIARAMFRGLPHVAVFEDDIVFVEGFREKWEWAQALIPVWAELIVIGGREGSKRDREEYGTIREKEHVAGPWWQPAHIRCRQAYIVKQALYPALLTTWSDETIPGDVSWNKLLDKVILHQPMLVRQRAGFSDIEGRSVDYGRLFEASDAGL